MVSACAQDGPLGEDTNSEENPTLIGIEVTGTPVVIAPDAETPTPQILEPSTPFEVVDSDQESTPVAEEPDLGSAEPEPEPDLGSAEPEPEPDLGSAEPEPEPDLGSAEPEPDLGSVEPESESEPMTLPQIEPEEAEPMCPEGYLYVPDDRP